jgi:hypothetical protein
MGWTTTPGGRKEEVIAETLEAFKPIEHAVRREDGMTVLWMLCEHAGRKLIALALVAKRGGASCYRPAEWGVKEMDETVGPCYYSCPVRLIDRADEPLNSYAAAWREKVRTRHLARVAPFSSGRD